MLEFYPAIRLWHIAAVIVSGSLFFLRGCSLLAGQRWPMAAPVRYLSYTIDTILLTAALMLMSIVRQYPFVHGWLTVKVALLVVYILLGVRAFSAKHGRPARIAAFVAALLVFVFMFTIARAHHPLGLFAMF